MRTVLAAPSPPGRRDGTAREVHTEDMTPVPAPTHLEVRPRRVRLTCRIAAVVIMVVSVVTAVLILVSPAGAVDFGLDDALSVVAIGLVAAAAVLWFARPRLVADASSVTVRNLGSTRRVPWQVVMGVRFDSRTSWAVLDLADDDTLAVMAIQKPDGVAAETAVAELRAMLAAAHRPGGSARPSGSQQDYPVPGPEDDPA